MRIPICWRSSFGSGSLHIKSAGPSGLAWRTDWLCLEYLMNALMMMGASCTVKRSVTGRGKGKVYWKPQECMLELRLAAVFVNALRRAKVPLQTLKFDTEKAGRM